MDVEAALELVNHLIFSQTENYLDDLQTAIFRGSWAGKSYTEIAESYPCNESYAKEIGSKLWKLLSSAFGESVGKKSFKAALERRWKVYQSTHISSSQALFIDRLQASQPDPSFVGRESAIANLNNLVNQGAKVILIHSKGGVGKTTLAQNYLQQQFGSYIEFPIAKETQNITSVESLIEERLKQLGEEPGREFGVSLDRLKRKLQTARIGVLIDNLEPALDGNGKIIEPHRRYVDLLTALAHPQLQSVTLITSRECIRESAVTVRHYRLEGLNLAAWQEFFNSRLKTPLSPPEAGGGNLAPLLVGGDGGGQIVELSPALTSMHKAYGGNAKAMEILSSAILEEYDGNIEAFWQEIQEDLLSLGELEDLVAYQFNRLQKFNSDAYKLLCRMGCYRYQDVPTVPEEGLFYLLWDVPEIQHRPVVKSLRDRSLVEFKNGEYWLHPVIRSEAIRRLKESESWETANHIAAEFWTESVKAVETVEDARKAFEAYYHYIETENFILAGTVIINQRANSWEDTEPLGRSFYRLGLLQPMIYSINFIITHISHIEPSYVLSRLYNLLGDLYWLTGNIRQAIVSHEKSGIIAYQSLENFTGDENIKFWLKRLTRYCLFNTALCYLDLWEIEEAIRRFEKVKLCWEADHASDTEKGFYVGESLVDTWSCLAFLNSCLGYLQKASNLAENAYNHLTVAKLDSWCTGYAPLFLSLTYKNLGDTQKSFEMNNRALAYAEESYYTQVKAKALTGLAALYREQGDFETALSHHSESIELLEKIGAKCDLAEAYYQLGLTYQKMGNAQKSQENFDKAIQLFREMEAPKQVEKVEQAMETGG